MLNKPEFEANSPPRQLHWPRRATLVLALAVVVIAILLGSAWLRRPTLPPLESRQWDEARSRWELAAPQDYLIEVRVSGRQPAIYRVEVRDGIVLAALRNGRPLTQQRTLGTWSVPGMFETIGEDLRNQDRARQGRSDTSLPLLTLRARFHPHFGYPERYLRLEHARMGTNPEVSWEVTRFTANE